MYREALCIEAIYLSPCLSLFHNKDRLTVHQPSHTSNCSSTHLQLGALSRGSVHIWSHLTVRVLPVRLVDGQEVIRGVKAVAERVWPVAEGNVACC